MKQKIFVGIFIIIISLMCLIPNHSFAITSAGGYTIQTYDVNMVVNKDNTFDITENITVNFSEPKHGIFRKIPLKNSVAREDGSKSNNNARITNISVNASYSAYSENGYKVIKIGDADRTVTGKQNYTIKYKYNIGKDPLKDADELYFNLIGDQWDTTIDKVNFKITMPAEFDKSKLGFSSGYRGSTESSNVTYTVSEDMVITGSTLSTLNPSQGLTVRLTLPDGYFKAKLDFFPVFVIILCVVFVYIAYTLWSKYGKDDEVIETVEFYPPEGYNSAEVGFLYEGSVDTQSVISLLIYLANKGYLKIEETEQKGLFSKSKGFRITKLKEYDGDNESERLFFEGLFKRKDSVTASDLYDRFYTTLEKIRAKINSRENKNKIFEATASGKGKYVILMIIALFILITVKPVTYYGEPGMLPFAIIFPGVGLFFTLFMLFGSTGPVYINGKPSSSNIATKVFAIVWGIGFGGFPWAGMVLPALLQDKTYLITYIIGIISISALIFFLKIMPKRTPYGTEILGKLRGFKRFLETAEKEKLEDLVNENPEYFYNILPYTYALGVSDKWMKQFEAIALQAPNWYDSPNSFSMHEFNHFMNHTMTSAQTAMSSSPSSSSGGGGSSGGGFSGGGSGGGGGGSW